MQILMFLIVCTEFCLQFPTFTIKIFCLLSLPLHTWKFEIEIKIIEVLLPENCLKITVHCCLLFLDTGSAKSIACHRTNYSAGYRYGRTTGILLSLGWFSPIGKYFFRIFINCINTKIYYLLLTQFKLI